MTSVTLKTISLRDTLEDGYNGPKGEFVFTLTVSPLPISTWAPGLAVSVNTPKLSLDTGTHSINLSCGVSEDWGFPLHVSLHVREIDDTSADDTLTATTLVQPVSWTAESAETKVWLAFKGRTIGEAIIVSRFSGQRVQELKQGDVVALVCQGDAPKSTYRFLDGNTVNGTVRLLSSMKSGSYWEVHELGNESLNTKDFAFKCLGHIPGKHWLDGNTINSTISLAPETGGGYTGTRWAATWNVVDPMTSDFSPMALRCMGHVPNKDAKVWLDGNTLNGETKLVSDHGGQYSGAIWRAIKVNPFAYHKPQT